MRDLVGTSQNKVPGQQRTIFMMRCARDDKAWIARSELTPPYSPSTCVAQLGARLSPLRKGSTV